MNKTIFFLTSLLLCVNVSFADDIFYRITHLKHELGIPDEEMPAIIEGYERYMEKNFPMFDMVLTRYDSMVDKSGIATTERAFEWHVLYYWFLYIYADQMKMDEIFMVVSPPIVDGDEKSFYGLGSTNTFRQKNSVSLSIAWCGKYSTFLPKLISDKACVLIMAHETLHNLGSGHRRALLSGRKCLMEPDAIKYAQFTEDVPVCGKTLKQVLNYVSMSNNTLIRKSRKEYQRYKDPRHNKKAAVLRAVLRYRAKNYFRG